MLFNFPEGYILGLQLFNFLSNFFDVPANTDTFPALRDL